MDGNGDAHIAGLLRKGIAGDERAYVDFLERAAALVRGFARHRITSGSLDAEDIVQETLLAIHIKRHTWDNNAPVTPWLYAIARHKLIDAFRRNGRRMETTIEDFVETIADQQPDTVRDWEVNRALQSLAPGQRSVVSAISVEGRSISETATTLGMSETAVRVSLHRGLAAIARRFGRT
ncbi:sigma-70 family RNA polymerase sigma factor [Mesorhizobium sp. NBSH29]|nr:sigma-70 family RNA polymerase sigma factor [Mesorhizobium sp. NBSH29]QPC87317.1 sigma-70 family RNA polymerase sigma factor [Mesorhizobium sp. NBSH29]